MEEWEHAVRGRLHDLATFAWQLSQYFQLYQHVVIIHNNKFPACSWMVRIVSREPALCVSWQVPQGMPVPNLTDMRSSVWYINEKLLGRPKERSCKKGDTWAFRGAVNRLLLYTKPTRRRLQLEENWSPEILMVWWWYSTILNHLEYNDSWHS